MYLPKKRVMNQMHHHQGVQMCCLHLSVNISGVESQMARLIRFPGLKRAYQTSMKSVASRFRSHILLLLRSQPSGTKMSELKR